MSVRRNAKELKNNQSNVNADSTTTKTDTTTATSDAWDATGTNRKDLTETEIKTEKNTNYKLIDYE